MSNRKHAKPRSSQAIHNSGSILKERWPLIRFWLSFIGVVLLFYFLAVQPFYIEYIQTPVSSFFAKTSSSFLNLLGHNTSTNGLTISSPGYSLSVKKGCDAIAPTVLLIAGILIFPGSPKKKALGILYGVILLMSLNLIRIISLWFTGVYFPDFFDFMHIELWQVLFIASAILYFGFWLRWASTRG